MKIQALLILMALCALLAAIVMPVVVRAWKGIVIAKTHRRRALQVQLFLNWLAMPFVIGLAFLAGFTNRVLGREPDLVLANYLATPAGDEDTKLADAAIGRRLLVKIGSDENHIAVCTTADIPLGATRDASAAAAEVRLSFAQFGLYDKELEGVADGVVAAGDMLVPGVVAGTLRKLPATTGTYYICGRAKTAAADTTPVVYIPTFPIQRVVP